MPHSKKTNKQSPSNKKSTEACMKNNQSFSNNAKDCHRSSYEDCHKSQNKNNSVSDFESEYDNYFR